MRLKINWVLIILVVATSCGSKKGENQEISDPNELAKTEVEGLDSINIKGLGEYKAFEMLTADLDGDKISETITIRVSPEFFKEESDNPMGIIGTPALICIGNQFIRTQLYLNAFYVNGKAFSMEIKDLNTADNYKEIVFMPFKHGEDPPGDYQIIRYTNRQMAHFNIPGDSVSNDRLIINKNGTFSIDYTIDEPKGGDSVSGKYKARDIKKIFMLSKKGIIFKTRDSGQVYIKEFAG